MVAIEQVNTGEVAAPECLDHLSFYSPGEGVESIL